MHSDPNRFAPFHTATDAIQVCVRIRPLDARELHSSVTKRPVVTLDSSRNVAILRNPAPHATLSGVPRPNDSQSPQNYHEFQYDGVFSSFGGEGEVGGGSQAEVHERLGRPLVAHALSGFNSCLFAYGQTGSGKTYTMMGADVGSVSGDGAGVIPRVCCDLFVAKAAAEALGHSRWTVELGYVEVYRERVTDLLGKRRRGPRGVEEAAPVEVREHPSRGVFLEGQRLVEVGCVEEVLRLLEAGNAVRRTAATKMNERSSRSHAMVMLLLREERRMLTRAGETIVTAGKSSRMNLVDLAGSERVAQSEVEGVRFEEATHINLSLTTLGRVIDMLAEMAKKGTRCAWLTPPYRESKLTYILRDSLGGNSKTFMVATVSPSALNYEETLGTLRYASRAREVVNVAQVNEDPRARRIRELEEEMEAMRGGMEGADPAYVAELVEKLALLESEAQRRAADLEALEKEREQSHLREQMLRATEVERAELAARAERLQGQVVDSRRRAEDLQAVNLRLREEHAAREREMRDEISKREAAMSMIRRRKDAEVESGVKELERVVSDLEEERRARSEAMSAIESQQQVLNATLLDSQRTETEKLRLVREKEAVLERLAQLQVLTMEQGQLLTNLEYVREECDEQTVCVKLLEVALEEMEERFQKVVFFLGVRAELTAQWEDTYSEYRRLTYESELNEYIFRITDELDHARGEAMHAREESTAAMTTVRRLQSLLEEEQGERRRERAKWEQECSASSARHGELENVQEKLSSQITYLEHTLSVTEDRCGKLELDKKKYDAALRMANQRVAELEVRLRAHQDRAKASP